MFCLHQYIQLSGRYIEIDMQYNKKAPIALKSSRRPSSVAHQNKMVRKFLVNMALNDNWGPVGFLTVIDLLDRTAKSP